MIRAREQHKSEILAFLQRQFRHQGWKISRPIGRGHETYFAENDFHSLFIKIGANVDRYQILSSLGFSPRVTAVGQLSDGTPILFQEKIVGKNPSRKEFHRHLDQFARAVGDVHRCEALKKTLPEKSSDLLRDVGLEVLETVKKRWENYKEKAPASVHFVDKSIEHLKGEIQKFHGRGLVASHNDVCNGNWLISSEGQVFLLDLESMSLDDAALDLGALLWWYYPRHMRENFLEIAGYTSDRYFRERMRIRMAIHCLNIVIPREDSFDQFRPDEFEKSLEDFRAALDGKENPQGYA